MVLDAMRLLWEDPNAQRNGRRGQPQNGVDVYGKAKGKQVGAQSKNMEKLSHAEVNAEIEKAQSFVPNLQALHFAIAGQRDKSFQELIRKLSAQRVESGYFELHVWFFDDIISVIAKDKGLTQKYWGSFLQETAVTANSVYPCTESWRLLIDVTKSMDSSYSGDKYDVYIALVSPDGSLRTSQDPKARENLPWPQDSRYGRFFLATELATMIREWFLVSALFVEEVSPAGLLILSLPIEMLVAGGAYDLLRAIIAECKKDQLDHLPLILACSSRQKAASSNVPLLMQACRKARRLSRQIVEKLEDSAFVCYRWLWIHDKNLASEGPKCFQGSGGCKNHQFRICLTDDFDREITRERQSPQEENTVQGSQAMLLSWSLDLCKDADRERYGARLLRILCEGIPFFVIDCPSLGDPREPLLSDQNSSADHPIDILMKWTCEEFTRNYIRLHEPLASANTKRESWLQDYLRHSIVFWEDHRFEPPDRAQIGNQLDSSGVLLPSSER